MTKDSSPAKPKGGFFLPLLIILLIAWMFRSFLFAPFSIPSGSMLPTVLIGDHLVVSKWPYGYSRASFLFGFPPIEGRFFSTMPERGDIVVFRGPQGNDVIKRVIGLPGDSVATRGGTLVLNGRPVRRESLGRFAITVSPNSPCKVVPPGVPFVREGAEGPECLYPLYRETLPNGRSYRVLDQVANPIADEYGPVSVPQGHVFLMGDNRDDSADSRFAAPEGMGYVPMEALVGRAEIIFWSTDGSAEWLKPWTWFTALRGRRIGETI